MWSREALNDRDRHGGPDDNESLAYMQRVLRQNGVFEMLEAKGIKEETFFD